MRRVFWQRLFSGFKTSQPKPRCKANVQGHKNPNRATCVMNLANIHESSKSFPILKTAGRRHSATVTLSISKFKRPQFKQTDDPT